MAKKIIIVAVALMMCLGILSSCVDYGYEFHFSVVGENGTIVRRWWDSYTSEWRENSSPVFVNGANKASKKHPYQLELTAIPDDGYQVKEWICDGRLVEGNKSNSFIAISSDYTHYWAVITVEFEPVPSKN